MWGHSVNDIPRSLHKVCLRPDHCQADSDLERPSEVPKAPLYSSHTPCTNLPSLLHFPTSAAPAASPHLELVPASIAGLTHPDDPFLPLIHPLALPAPGPHLDRELSDDQETHVWLLPSLRLCLTRDAASYLSAVRMFTARNGVKVNPGARRIHPWLCSPCDEHFDRLHDPDGLPLASDEEEAGGGEAGEEEREKGEGSGEQGHDGYHLGYSRQLDGFHGYGFRRHDET